MPSLYQYLKENYKENEPIILAELQIKDITEYSPAAKEINR